VLGAEIDRRGAWNEIIELVERHQAQVFVAPMSARCSFPEDHPSFMGFLPANRQQIVQKLEGSDCVCVIGAPVFTYHVEGDGPHAPENAELFQLTEDPESAARAPIGMSIVGDVLSSIRELLKISSPEIKRENQPGRRPANRAEPSEPLSVAFVLQTLAEMRNPDDVIVEEAPTARVVMHEYLPITRPATFFTMSSGGLGYGIAAAAGVSLARKQQKIIAIIGDGSTMYSVQTLWTAAQLQLNITFIVLNNRRYAAMVRFGAVLGFPSGAHLPGTDLPGLDFVAIAQGHGCPGARIESAEALPQAMSKALATEGPYVLEVVVA
jgi:benzoylformate decarboxylase